MSQEGSTVAAVILTRGQAPLLKKCLEGLKAASEKMAGLRVYVVEHRTAEAIDIVREFGWERIAVEDPDDNESFSSLNNLAVSKAAPSDYVLLLNNDCFMRPNSLEPMIRVMEEKPDVGIVAPKSVRTDGKIDHIGVVVNHFGIPHHLGYERPDDGTFTPAGRSDYYDAVSFSCALIRRSLWEQLDGLDPDYFWNYEDADFCYRAMEQKFRCFTTVESVVVHDRGMSSDNRKTPKHSIARNLGIFTAKWLSNSRLEKLLDIVIVKDVGPTAGRNLNVAFVPAGQGVGISWWRIELPARKLAEKKLANVKTIYGAMGTDPMLAALEVADVVIWQSHSAEPLKRIAQNKSGRDWAMIYEYDDHPIYLSPYASVYRSLGTQEVAQQLENGGLHWLWRDGQDGFDLEKNRETKARKLEIMSLSDAITTTTPPLADYFRTLNGKVFVLPNCIDFELYPRIFDLFDRKPGPVRIGWWGGDNHYHDVSVIGQEMRDYVNSNDVTFVVLGQYYRGPFRGIDMNKVEQIPWTHIEGFAPRLGAAGLDVVIIPLANPALPYMAFNGFKSDIKWLEAAAFKLPAVVQGGVRAYENCIDGENAMTFTTGAEFMEKLDRLVKDAALRRRIGQAAYDWAREYRDIDKEIHRWLEVYQRVVEGREIPIIEGGEVPGPVVAEGGIA